MTKKFTIGCLMVIFMSNFLYGQGLTAGFPNKSSLVKETVPYQKTVKIPVYLKGKINQTTYVDIADSKIGSADSKYFTILTPTLVFTPADNNSKNEVVKEVYLQVIADSTMELNTNFIVKMSSLVEGLKVVDGYYRLDIVNIPKRDPDSDANELNQYRISIGTNFDLLDGTKLKDLYKNLTVLKPDLFKVRKKNGGHINIGLNFGLYGNRNISSDSTTSRTVTYFSTTAPANGNTSYTQTSRRYYPNSITTSNNFGIFFSPVIRLNTKQTDPKKDNTEIFFSIDFEGIKRRFDTKYNYKIFDSTVTQITPPNPIPTRREIKPSSISTQRTDIHYGGGLILHHADKYIDFTLKGSVGTFWALQSNNRNQRIGRGEYYLVQYNIFPQVFKLNIGGEVRGYFDRSEPFFALFLSKTFTLIKLAEFLK